MSRRKNGKNKRSWLLLLLSFLGAKAIIKKNNLDK